MIKVITKFLSKKTLITVLFEILEQITKNTSTTVDDKLVQALRLAVEGQDYGLQRKAGKKKPVVATDKAKA